MAETLPSGSDLQPVEAQLERAIRERRYSDTKLVNWWLYWLLLSWITLGIYPLIVFFQRINRIDRFSARKRAYYVAVIDWTARYAEHQGAENEANTLLTELREQVQTAYASHLRMLRAGLSLVLTIITFGFYGLYTLYRENRYWWDSQIFEQDFDDGLSQVWSKLGLLRYPLTFSVDQGKRRSFALYLFLSVVTLTVWRLVWDYKIHTDPDHLYQEFHSIEDTVLQVARTQ